MATLRFNNILIEAARRLGETRTDATSGGDSGKTYTSAILSKYANDAVRDLLRESLVSTGDVRFMQTFPEYVKRMGNTVLSSNTFQKPSDCWFMYDLFDVTNTNTLHRKSKDFERMRQGDLPLVSGGSFYELGTTVITAGTGASIVVNGHYIMKHTDIVPDNTPATPGGGKRDQTGFSGWTAATKTLVTGAVPLPAGFVTGDIGKALLFWNSVSGSVYDGIIATVPANNTVTLTGWNLPTADSAAEINRVFMPESQLASGDLLLTQNWDTLIIDAMVKKALADATATLDIG